MLVVVIGDVPEAGSTGTVGVVLISSNFCLEESLEIYHFLPKRLVNVSQFEESVETYSVCFFRFPVSTQFVRDPEPGQPKL